MLMKLNSLTESLEKKYLDEEQLNESVELNERFSDSMPKWLKDRLGFSSIAAGDSEAHSYYKNNLGIYRNTLGAARQKYPDQPHGGFQKPRGYYGDIKKLGLAPAFLDAGVDLNKVEVIEAPVPEKVPRLTKNQQIIPIFLMDNGQVWAKGINDREEYRGTPFRSVPNGEIIDNCKAYAYIDLSDPNINTVGDIREARQQLKDEVKAIPNYYRNINGYGTDKSGYSNNFNLRKYKEVLKYTRHKKLPGKLAKLAMEMEEYKSQLVDILESDAELGSMDGEALMHDISRAVDELKDMSASYRKGMEIFQGLEEDADEYDRNSICSTVERYMSNCKRCAERIDYYVGDYMKVTADW